MLWALEPKGNGAQIDRRIRLLFKVSSLLSIAYLLDAIPEGGKYFKITGTFLFNILSVDTSLEKTRLLCWEPTNPFNLLMGFFSQKGLFFWHPKCTLLCMHQ